jgi:threonyl-tRNA synthetase
MTRRGSLSQQRTFPVAISLQKPMSENPHQEKDSEGVMYGSGDGGERLVDLAAPLNEDVALELLKENDEAALKVVRHSAAAM